MKTILTSIAAGSLLAALAAAQTPRYTITDLGTLPGGTYSYAYGMNSAGWVTGGGCHLNPDRRREPNRLPLEWQAYHRPRHTSGRAQQRGGWSQCKRRSGDSVRDLQDGS